MANNLKEGKITLDQKREAYAQGLIDAVYRQLRSYGLDICPDPEGNSIRLYRYTKHGEKRLRIEIFCKAWIQLDGFDYDSDGEVFDRFSEACVKKYLNNTEYPIAGRHVVPWDDGWGTVCRGNIYDPDEFDRDYKEGYNTSYWTSVGLEEEMDDIKDPSVGEDQPKTSNEPAWHTKDTPDKLSRRVYIKNIPLAYSVGISTQPRQTELALPWGKRQFATVRVYSGDIATEDYDSKFGNLRLFKDKYYGVYIYNGQPRAERYRQDMVDSKSLTGEELVKKYNEVNGMITEDTVKTSDGKWTNKGKEGTHGKFKTKKQADAQRKAMFANGYHESLDGRAFEEDIKAFEEEFE